jgi:hypothetical protein
MRKASIVVLFLLVAFAVAQAGELHSYNFNSDASDSIGSAHGTLFGGATVTSSKYLLLNGSSAYVQFNQQIVPTSGTYTVALFAFEAQPTGTYIELISQGFSTGPGFYIGHDPIGIIRATDSWGNTGVPFPTGGGFHHFALVVDSSSSTSKLYLDGSMVASVNFAIATTPSGGTTRFGRQFNPFAEFFNGGIDDVHIYNHALTANEVAALASAGPSVDTDNDGVFDSTDNCPLIGNPNQQNTDGDLLGDACDSDDDNDGVADATDNCPLTANPTQGNNDSDALGDACDPDDDNDGTLDTSDNCPLVANAQKIAFVAGPEGARDIWVMNPDGSNPVRLTTHPAEDVGPYFSPNGSKIMFISHRDGNFEIYSMNADGTNQTRLTNNPTNDYPGGFSYDGSRIVFSSDRDGAGLEIYVMNADGTGQTRITNNAANDFQPVFSPDGSKIYFVSERDANGEIYVMNTDGTNPVNLTNNPGNDGQPNLRWDGTRILFTSNRTGNYEIFAMDANGANPINLTNDSLTDTESSFSPDGTRITWRSERGFSVWVMNADGSGQTNLSNAVGNKHQPSWGGGADSDGDGVGDACDNWSCNSQLPGLISWWRGEGNAVDSTGPNHGTLQGGTTYTRGKIGQGFQMHNYFTDGVRVGAQVYEMQGGSVSAWFNWDGQETSGWFSPLVILGSTQGGETSSPMPFVYYGTLWWQFSSTIYYGGRYNTGIPIIPGRWYHIAMTYDSQYLVKLYVDGVLVDASHLSNPVDFRDEFKFGDAAGFDPGITGIIDEVQIYNRPLTDCEVRNLYKAANGLPCEVCDSVASTTTSVTSPSANAAGWNNSNVDVSLSAVDDPAGTGISRITYSATGAQIIPSTTVSSTTANLSVTAEGTTTITYFAEDNAGNVEAANSITIKIDKTAPTFSCDTADNQWHAANITLAGTAQDALSGLSTPSEGNFLLSTNVVAGTEISNAFTDSYTICDAAGNCATVGPVGNNKIDRKAPIFSLGVADGLWHSADVSISGSASDGGSGLGNPADANFALVTNVPAGTEINNASTGIREICDAVGNCVIAGPVNGNKVDKKRPVISIPSPASIGYRVNSFVQANYFCTDGGAGFSSCVGTVPVGGYVNTALPIGPRSFNVNASDQVGNTSTATVVYTVLSPLVSLDVASITFADQPLFTTSETRSVVITNTGNDNLFVWNLNFTGADPSEFRIVSSWCQTLPITPGGSCRIDLAFRPTVTGGRKATLNIHDDAPGTPHVVALSGNGAVAQVYSWGWNATGQVGDNATINRLLPTKTLGKTNVHGVAAGQGHSIAIEDNGTVWTWGLNDQGQLGDNSTTNRLIPVQVIGLSNMVSIAAGTFHSLALNRNGTVWAWGENLSGQLGDNTKKNRRVPVQVSGLSDVIAIAAGGSHSLALKSDGSVWAWGGNTSGALGDGTTTNRLIPTRVTNLIGAVSIACGRYHSLAVKTDGTVWEWGSSLTGGAFTPPRLVPVALAGINGVQKGGWRILSLRRIKDGRLRLDMGRQR